MCAISLHKSLTCRHQDHTCKWVQISRPCYPGAGFLTCPRFAENALRLKAPNVVRGMIRTCPRHDYMGCYDRNMVKMVEEVRPGKSWFGPPDAKPAPRRKEKLEGMPPNIFCAIM